MLPKVKRLRVETIQSKYYYKTRLLAEELSTREGMKLHDRFERQTKAIKAESSLN